MATVKVGTHTQRIRIRKKKLRGQKVVVKVKDTLGLQGEVRGTQKVIYRINGKEFVNVETISINLPEEKGGLMSKTEVIVDGTATSTVTPVEGGNEIRIKSGKNVS